MARLSLDLLAQARVLARQEPTRPKQASLRRSVSTSYYALFHFVIEEAVKMAVGTVHERTKLRQFAARAFVHGKMRAVCDEFVRPTPRSELLKPFWPHYNVRDSADVRLLADNFGELQELRHQADYDLAVTFDREQAGEAADLAEEAIAAWNRLKVQHELLARFFALSLMLWPGLGGR